MLEFYLQHSYLLTGIYLCVGLAMAVTMLRHVNITAVALFNALILMFAWPAALPLATVVWLGKK